MWTLCVGRRRIESYRVAGAARLGQRATGLDDRQTDECFETEFTARTNPHRGYITIIEGCDKFCAFCVVPYTRGKERSRTSESVLAEARQMAEMGYSDIQLLGQTLILYRDPSETKTFAELLRAVAQVPGIRRVRFTTSHPRDFGRDIVEVMTRRPGFAITCICRCRVGRRDCWKKCRGCTRGSSIWNELVG